ncbi:uncharacterized protein LOC109710971 isoform X2 [Ananas comosus]|uniref:Uncharacterized protein LOC109710971 isoform X2 n=1 Tax=Ananas comosus TaxID=4615 RepID=A0A199VU28_ANACO|nr:uncharacterized protein LOC109710971 isoform X2 [Ananas comosus]OAY80200.1 cAMP-regulated phosphoprotein 21 [Ananas comosus]
MEGSSCADDPSAPDSWEMADLEESVSRLLLSSGKNAPGADDASRLELAAAAPATLSDSSVERGGAALGDAVIEVDQFLREALEKPRERISILRMEQDIVKFIRDPTQQQLEFQALPTSYLRLAAHRLAQHYYLQSVAIPDSSSSDGSGSRVVLRKTHTECRFPPIRLADIPVNLPQEDNNTVVKLAIKQRPQRRTQNTSNANVHSMKTNYQKSVEERKEEYNRARARIFSNNNSSSSSSMVVKEDDEPKLPESLDPCSSIELTSDAKLSLEGCESASASGINDSCSGGNRLSKNANEKDPAVGRYRAGGRVAIFRDREVDRKDPDYDRNYDRYMQRFDPGFGFGGGPYTMQPLFSPAVNYNTEFPQLGSGHRSQLSIEQQPRPIPQHLHGPWSAPPTPNPLGYRPSEGMMAPFNPNHIGGSAASSIYMHSSQYSGPPHPGMAFVHPNEHMQPFVRSQQQQPDASFGLARPR